MSDSSEWNALYKFAAERLPEIHAALVRYDVIVAQRFRKTENKSDPDLVAGMTEHSKLIAALTVIRSEMDRGKS